MAKPLADTTTVLTRGSGEKRIDETLPTTFLSAEDATILCHYRAFLDLHELRESIYCDECAGPPDPGAKIARGDNQVAIFCAHHVWFFQGAIPAPAAHDISLGAIIPAGRPESITITDLEIEQVNLGESVAKMLRAYRRVLVKYGWKEALDCRTCWANSKPEGCRAFITEERIGIMCRHRHMTYVGQTT